MLSIKSLSAKRWVWALACFWLTGAPGLWAQKTTEPAAKAVSAREGKASLEPPFQEMLLLDDKKDPEVQIRALQNALEGDPKDPQNARRLLTIAYLYDEVLDQPDQAAKGYEDFANRARNSRYTLHARFRAAELLYQQIPKVTSTQEKQYLLGQVAKLDTMISQSTQPRRSWTGAPAPPPPPVWEKDVDGRWVEVPTKDVYDRALRRIDQVSRDKWSYRMLDILFRAMGGRPGISHVLALLLLAVLLKLILHPLTRKQYTSMAKMQVVQPHLKKIQEKYRDNPQKLQAEIMRVYREHGVNPMAGCLPMFIQLPVLFSAYGGIRAYAYQFNQAPPVLGINLGQPNLILLLLYAVSMYVSQKLAMMRNPQGPMDPQQEQMQKMMLFMPLMFTVMMWTYGWPSAFYLYWLAFNVVSTAEQWFVTSKLKKPVGTGVRPLVGAEGSLDQADGGKEGKPLAPAAEKEEKPSRPRPRSQRRPLSVVPPPGSKESRKRRVTRRR